jgi:hypothetical protein
MDGAMSKLLTVFFLSVFFVSCNDSGGGGKSCNASNQTCLFNVSGLDPDYADGEIPNEALTFDTNLNLVNFSSNDQDKVYKAAELIKRVVASEEFKAAVINHVYNGKKTFVDNGGLTNSQIYQRFLQGAEQLTPALNNALDVELELYYESSSVVGYTQPNTKRIWINTKYFNYYNEAQVAGNITHEWMHKLGFGHTSAYTAERAYSVPYAVGYLMNRLAYNYLD